ncbi:hypothetical protein ACOMHN_051758 [Nucella lapillus]
MLTLLSTFSYVLRARRGTRCVQTRAMKHHIKARDCAYPRAEKIRRCPVPDDKVSWDELFPEYDPVDYTAPSVQSGPVWADVDVRKQALEDRVIKWNSLDGGKINRKSHTGKYELDSQRCPRNPVGRTGMIGRGLLGRWGPNHAADPIVTRWKRDAKGEKVMCNGRPVLQFIAVQRKDSGEWALPGGMVDAGEVINMTIQREFGEEALNSLEASPEERKIMKKHISDLFATGTEIYRGYVDDPRNTDNAWMETIAKNFHDAQGDSVANFRLHAGDDAVGVQWMDLDSSMKLYASHVDFLEETARKLGAHW